MKSQTQESDGIGIRSIKSSVRLLSWTFLWTATMVLADKAELYQWYTSDLISISAIAINAALGVAVILTFIRHINALDELQRKIQLEALAFALGVGFVAGFTYSLLVTAEFIQDSEISDLLILMAATYVICIIIGLVRYR